MSSDVEHNNSMELDQDLNRVPKKDEAALAFVGIKQKSRLAFDGESTALHNASAEENLLPQASAPSPTLIPRAGRDGHGHVSPTGRSGLRLGYSTPHTLAGRNRPASTSAALPPGHRQPSARAAEVSAGRRERSRRARCAVWSTSRARRTMTFFDPGRGGGGADRYDKPEAPGTQGPRRRPGAGGQIPQPDQPRQRRALHHLYLAGFVGNQQLVQRHRAASRELSARCTSTSRPLAMFASTGPQPYLGTGCERIGRISMQSRIVD